MKREGRQHGMVRSYLILPSPLNPRPNTRIINRFDSPPAAGLFTKVPSKPTNHSKFTGKCDKPRCSGCHLHPVCKSKNKTKGSQKNKNWRVMDQPDSNFSGLSATWTLDHLSNRYREDEVEYESGDDQDDFHMNYSCTLDYGDGVKQDDDSKCIYEVGFPFGMEQLVEVEKDGDGDEDWCLVESFS
ncbi:hypothetical protein SESBI_30214 [Sesbania bispinosa]|nr:hypothetical protein SESBI_30214 [Sesbania bispinosa]